MPLRILACVNIEIKLRVKQAVFEIRYKRHTYTLVHIPQFVFSKLLAEREVSPCLNGFKCGKCLNQIVNWVLQCMKKYVVLWHVLYMTDWVV